MADEIVLLLGDACDFVPVDPADPGDRGIVVNPLRPDDEGGGTHRQPPERIEFQNPKIDHDRRPNQARDLIRRCDQSQPGENKRPIEHNIHQHPPTGRVDQGLGEVFVFTHHVFRMKSMKFCRMIEAAILSMTSLRRLRFMSA